MVWTYHKVYVGASKWEGLHTHHLLSFNLHLLSFNFSIGGLGSWRGKRRERGKEGRKEGGGGGRERKGKKGGGEEEREGEGGREGKRRRGSEEEKKVEGMKGVGEEGK